MSVRYSTIFKNRMQAYGITLDQLGKMLGKERGLAKPLSRQGIHQNLKREDSLWKQTELEEWCKVLRLDIKKVLGLETSEKK